MINSVDTATALLAEAIVPRYGQHAIVIQAMSEPHPSVLSRYAIKARDITNFPH